MLHLLARLEGVGAGPTFGSPKPRLAYQAGQGAVGKINVVFVAQDLLETHDIAVATRQECFDERHEVLIALIRLARRWLWLTDDSTHRTPGDLKKTTDLTQGGVFVVEGQDRLSGFVRDHKHHTS